MLRAATHLTDFHLCLRILLLSNSPSPNSSYSDRLCTIYNAYATLPRQFNPRALRPSIHLPLPRSLCSDCELYTSPAALCSLHGLRGHRHQTYTIAHADSKSTISGTPSKKGEQTKSLHITTNTTPPSCPPLPSLARSLSSPSPSPCLPLPLSGTLRSLPWPGLQRRSFSPHSIGSFVCQIVVIVPKLPLCRRRPAVRLARDPRRLPA